MTRAKRIFGNIALVLWIVITCGAQANAGAQQTGSTTLSGTVTLGDTGKPIHGASVTILQLRRSVETDDNGKYEFQNVPPGTFDVAAHLDRANDVVQRVVVPASGSITQDFQIQLSGVRETVTVTATGTEESVSQSIQSVTVLSSVELAQKNPVSLGEALDHELGVAKRSFGPAPSRPVIRGFDGDRVLVLEDGMRVGALGSQSGDHSEPVDLLSVDRVEVVKGPATLLYGSNAIGGVVNAIDGHESPHKGVNGYLTTLGSTNSWQAGGSAGIEAGTDKLLFWANGGAQKANDYLTPLGRITNSYARGGNFSTGLGFYPGRGFFSANYHFDKRRYGIPFNQADPDAEAVYLTPRRHSIQFNGGFRDLKSFIENAKFSIQYTDYTHSEVDAETGAVNTTFSNKSTIFRGTFDQQKRGRLTGSFGVWGMHRNYESAGAEALAPPTKQDSFAVFALETIKFEHAALQFGGRVENNRYRPSLDPVRGQLPHRSFTGFSGAIGLRVNTWKGGAFVVNYSHSYRAPSLDELYNEGPHPGNATFEIGNLDLTRELGDGLDFGLRHSSKRIRAEMNGFFYHIDNFVFLAPTGNIQDGLIEAVYSQGVSRFTGFEGRLDAELHKNVWLNLGADYVNAKLTDTNTPLPRIPPLRGRAGVEFRYKGLTIKPEALFANAQENLFPTETRTAGYGLINVGGSYLIARQHSAHIISFNAFNLGDRLYRNHLSFIKEFAPEIGRGVRVTYTVRFF
ncbi:MAG TPA: TonB-dependent receptor [Pyrinomonadaceae bacterium]